jgi:predicted phosphodiesterase
MPLVLLFLIELYFYPAIKKKLNKRFLKFAYWSVTALTVILLVAGAFKPSVLWPRWAGVYVVGSLMIILFSKVIASLVLLFVDLFRLCRWSLIKVVRKSSKTEEENNISRSDFLNKVALYSAAIPLAGFVYGMIKTVFDYKVHKIKLPFKNLPRAFNGLKIVQISDIHSGTYVNQGPLETAIKIINDEKPDIIFFTGDLVNEIALEAYPYKHQLGSLNAPLGVFSILGNHDYGDYFRWNNIEDKKQNLIDLKNFQKDLGWNLLLNENRIIEKNGEKIAIVGVVQCVFPELAMLQKPKKEPKK